jgi:hypothetical protein
MLATFHATTAFIALDEEVAMDFGLLPLRELTAVSMPLLDEAAGFRRAAT